LPRKAGIAEVILERGRKKNWEGEEEEVEG
jgi:hypothetical protein